MRRNLLFLLPLLLLACATPRGPEGEPLSETDRVVRLQLYLDQRNFGPGVVDGRFGEFTGKALTRYQLARGLPLTRDMDQIEQQLALDPDRPIHTLYTIRESDQNFVGPVPRAPADQAKLRNLHYAHLGELVAERYHSSLGYLRALNPGVRLEGLQPGDTVRVPNVNEPFRIESLERGRTLPRNNTLARRTVEIDSDTRMLEVYEQDRLIAAFPITPGSRSLPAPPGTWRVNNITLLPYFRRDESMLLEGVRSEDYLIIPPGPNSPVGVVWMGLNRRGIGLHGTNAPETIGRSASHGCVRLSNWDAIKLTRLISAGSTVIIDRHREPVETEEREAE